ncbi:MAG: NADPH-dependent stearoyl-CoA 9-desaturase [Pseudonocardiales bacterium]|nr:NADPH-dependent stearoyl-CoA 9-desaturase [Pseudonocardiales bacterium]
MRDSDLHNPLDRLSPDEIERIGEEFEAIGQAVRDDLGDADARYIRNVIQFHRRLAAISRIVLVVGSRWRPTWLLGTAALSVAKIVENMEIGHNVLHGQWDWMNDPTIHSSTWDWDTASPAAAWKHSHNFVHHTYTNVIGKDKDVGYEILRVDPRQPWHPVYLLQPAYNVLLMALFEWGVAVHDLDFEKIRKGEKDMKQVKDELKAIGVKARRQVLKDYVAYPALSGKGWKQTMFADVTANIVRNFWAHAIIFCGHFPDQTYMFTEGEVRDESRGAWYVRQLIGAANIDGSNLFHFMSGNLSFQVEHHLYPDLPSSRYQQIAPKVKAVCEKYGLPYNTGPFHRQWGTMQRTILRLALPGGSPRPKPGAYVAPPPTPEELALREQVPAFP